MEVKILEGNWATSGNSRTWSVLDEQGRRVALVDKTHPGASSNVRVIKNAPELLKAIQDIEAMSFHIHMDPEGMAMQMGQVAKKILKVLEAE